MQPGLKPNRKGEPRRGGRVRGQPNKFNQHLKDLIVLAADEVGDVTMYLQNGTEDEEGKIIKNTVEDRGGALGYLKWLAVHEPKSYAAMLARMIPQDVMVGPQGPSEEVYETREELEAELKRRGLPTTPIFSRTPPQKAIEYKS